MQLIISYYMHLSPIFEGLYRQKVIY